MNQATEEWPQRCLNALRTLTFEGNYAATSFLESADWANGFAGGPYTAEVYLETCFYEWLRSGRGIDETNGSFEVFLEAAMLIVEAVICNPTVLDAGYNEEGKRTTDRPRRVIGIFDPRLDRRHCFARDEYEQFKYLHLTRKDDEEA